MSVSEAQEFRRGAVALVHELCDVAATDSDTDQRSTMLRHGRLAKEGHMNGILMWIEERIPFSEERKEDLITIIAATLQSTVASVRNIFSILHERGVLKESATGETEYGEFGKLLMRCMRSYLQSLRAPTVEVETIEKLIAIAGEAVGRGLPFHHHVHDPGCAFNDNPGYWEIPIEIQFDSKSYIVVVIVFVSEEKPSEADLDRLEALSVKSRMQRT